MHVACACAGACVRALDLLPTRVYYAYAYVVGG